MRNWSEYVWLVKHLEDTRFINSIRDIWWTVRPHNTFGTVEVRVCDMPGSLEDVCALATLVHCLVRGLSDQIEEGAYQHDCHPMLVSQNMWRAERFGLDANFVDTKSYESRPAREMFLDLLEDLEGGYASPDTAPRFERLRQMAVEPSWARRQLDVLDKTGNAADVVRQMTARK